ncbi:glycosyltransferase family 8 protein [Dysgonomonas sp. OttesenSCG-928-M03]|nr:glycosyltransferase family 8 protein [Dysgonomonas sp. OttesenSCG-928-M03]
MEKINIAFCTDDNYIMPCGIAMISLLENNKGRSVTFHIVGMDLKEPSKEKLQLISSRYSDVSVLFYEIASQLFESYGLSLYNSEYLSFSTYSRLFLGDILPPNINKVLYLDCDIVVPKDLSNLWDINIENYSVGGIPDLCMFNSKASERLGYKDTFQYINAGVLLINLKYWREKKVLNLFLDFYKEKQDKLLFHDQDIINGVLYDTKLVLPIKYNMVDFNFVAKQNIVPEYKDEVYEGLQDPVIIHFTASSKPWLKSCIHPLKEEFLKYKSISPWKDEALVWPSKKSFSRISRYYKRMILYSLKLKKRKYIELKKDTHTKKYNIV